MKAVSTPSTLEKSLARAAMAGSVPTGPAMAAAKAAQHTLPSQGVLAALRCVQHLLEPAPEAGKTAKSRQTAARHKDDCLSASRLLARLAQREEEIEAQLFPFGLVVAEANRQAETTQRDAYVASRVEEETRAYWRVTLNVAQRMPEPGAREPITPTFRNPCNTMGFEEPTVEQSGSARFRRYMRRLRAMIANDAMTDVIAITPVVILSDPLTHLQVLEMKPSARVAKTIAMSPNRDRYSDRYEACLRLATGKGTADDVLTASSGLSLTTGLTASQVIATAAPHLTVRESIRLLNAGQFTPVESPELLSMMQETFMTAVSVTALTFGRTNAARFGRRVDVAVSAMLAGGYDSIRQWHPWIPGPFRSLSEVIVSQGAGKALKETSLEWFQADKAVPSEDLPRYTLVTNTNREVVARLGFSDPEVVAKVLAKRGELTATGKAYTVEEVQLWLEVEALRNTVSLDAPMSTTQDSTATFGDFLEAEAESDPEDVIEEKAEEAKFREEIMLADTNADERLLRLLARMSDEEAVAYLMRVNETKNVMVTRGLLTRYRKEWAEKTAERRALLVENGWLRPDGTSVFDAPRFTDEDKALWAEVHHTASRPRHRATKTASALAAELQEAGMHPRAISVEIEGIFGREKAEKYIRTTAEQRLKDLFEARLTPRPDRILRSTDITAGLELLREEKINGYEYEVGANFIRKVANAVLNRLMAADKAAHRQQVVELGQTKPSNTPAEVEATTEATTVEEDPFSDAAAQAPAGEISDFDLEDEFGSDAA